MKVSDEGRKFKFTDIVAISFFNVWSISCILFMKRYQTKGAKKWKRNQQRSTKGAHGITAIRCWMRTWKRNTVKRVVLKHRRKQRTGPHTQAAQYDAAFKVFGGVVWKPKIPHRKHAHGIWICSAVDFAEFEGCQVGHRKCGVHSITDRVDLKKNPVLWRKVVRTVFNGIRRRFQ